MSSFSSLGPAKMFEVYMIWQTTDGPESQSIESKFVSAGFVVVLSEYSLTQALSFISLRPLFFKFIYKQKN